MNSSEENITVERLDLKPEWVEDSGPKSEDLLRPLVLFFLGGFIIILFLGGGLGEILATILTIWISLFVIFAGIKNIKSISPWKRNIRKSEMQNLPLKSTSETAERALEGLELSQMLIEKRLRRDLIEKIKEKKGLSEKEMNKLMENPSKLKKVINDEELYMLIMNSKTIKDLIQRETESTSSKLINFFTTNKNVSKKNKGDENFEKRMRKMIKRVSEWENG